MDFACGDHFAKGSGADISVRNCQNCGLKRQSHLSGWGYWHHEGDPDAAISQRDFISASFVASNAIDYAKFFSRSHGAVIRVYDEADNVIETHEQAGDFKEP